MFARACGEMPACGACPGMAPNCGGFGGDEFAEDVVVGYFAGAGFDLADFSGSADFAGSVAAGADLNMLQPKPILSFVTASVIFAVE